MGQSLADIKLKLPVAPNLLNHEFQAAAPDLVYVSDITYIWTREGWLYLAIVLDLFSRQSGLVAQPPDEQEIGHGCLADGDLAEESSPRSDFSL